MEDSVASKEGNPGKGASTRLVENKRFVIDTSHEDDFELTPEQQADMDRAMQRKALVKPVLDTLIPDKTLEEANEIIAKGYKKTVGELDNEQKLMAGNIVRNGQSSKDYLAGTIARKEIPNEKLGEYVTGLVELVRELTPNGEDVNIDSISGPIKELQSVERVKFYTELARQWKEKFLIGVDDKTFATRAGEFRSIIYAFEPSEYSGRQYKMSDDEIKTMFDAYIDVYAIWDTLPVEIRNSKAIYQYKEKIRETVKEFSDPNQIRKMGQILQETFNYQDKDTLSIFLDAIGRYGHHHELGELAREGLIGKLLPALQNKDPQVGILLESRNIWGMRKGDFGVADFLCHAYAIKVTPPNINEMFMALREIPTANLARLEKNRLDALTLASPFGILRDFIHDQRPYVHEVVNTMVYFYDTGDRKPLDQVVAKTDYFNSEERREALADRTRYEKEVEQRRYDRNEGKQMVKPIDVLRRLDENTKPIEETPPQTSDAEFNSMLQELARMKMSGHISKETLGDTMKHANQKLIKMMKTDEVGIEPNNVLAFAWLEQRGFNVIQGLSYEDQQSAYKQEWFLEILRFQELTASPKAFNEQEFNQFLQTVNKSDFRTAYRLIFQRSLDYISKLSGKYKDQGRENRIGALWSGNVAHELIGLTDLRPAKTQYGKRHRTEQLQPEEKRLRGD